MTRKKSKKIFFNFLTLLKKYKKNLVFAGLASLLLSLFTIITSLSLKYIIDDVFFSKALLTLMTIGIGMLCVILLQVTITIIRNFLLAYFAFDLDFYFLNLYFNHVIHLPITFFDTHKVGEIIARIDDTIRVRNALSEGILSIIMDVVMLIFLTIILFALNATLFAILICTVPLTVLIMFVFSKLFLILHPKSMKENAIVRSFMVESFSGIATIKAHAVEQYIYEEYHKKQMQNIETNWTIFKLHAWQMMTSDFITQITTLLFFWIGAALILKDSISIGTLLSFSVLSSNFTEPLKRLITIQSGVHEATSAAHRLWQILSLKKEDMESEKYIKPSQITGRILFDSVCFKYVSNAHTNENFSLEILPGQWTAFVGPTGCGKTTIIKLLLKFYSINSGRITIDGQDVRDIETSWIRSQIGYIPQDIYFFSGTIRNNLCLYNKAINFESILEASKKTGAHEFISKLPKRYDTIIGENGLTLSGGERQKIAITRALVHNPRILILDEATSNLDNVSEAKITELIMELREKKYTIISIAHKLPIIQNADIIHYLEGGEIKESGTHQELLKKNGFYKKMNESC